MTNYNNSLSPSSHPHNAQFSNQLTSINTYENNIACLLSYVKKKQIQQVKHTKSIYLRTDAEMNRSNNKDKYEKGNGKQDRDQRNVGKKRKQQDKKYRNVEGNQNKVRKEIEEINYLNTLNIEYQKQKLRQIEHARSKNIYPELQKYHYGNHYDKVYRKKKAPLLMQPISRYTMNYNNNNSLNKHTNMKQRSNDRSVTPSRTKSPILPLPRSRSISPVQRIKNSTEIKKYLDTNYPEYITKQFNSNHITQEQQSMEESKHNHYYNQQTPKNKIAQLENNIKKQENTIEVKQGDNNTLSNNNNFQLKVYPCDLDKDTILTYIADKMSEIVAIDQQLEVLRGKFEKHPVENKNNIITKCMWERGWMIDQKQVLKYLGIKTQIHPQLSKQQQYDKIEELCEYLIDKFLEGEFYWDKKFDKFITKRQINETHFMVSKMDLQKNGYLTISDLTCFINLHSSKQSKYKNKNLQIFFSRLLREENSQTKLPYKTFLNKICDEQKNKK